MGKKIVLCFIVFSLLISVVSATGIQLLCLEDGQKAEFSECNPSMDDYICSATSCNLCVNEIEPGIYCPANINSCNDAGVSGCTYLEDSINPPEDTGSESSSITLLSPANQYSKTEPSEIEFSFKVASSYEFEICELMVDNNAVASKTKPISLSTQKLYYTPEQGVHSWKIKCTKRSSYGGSVVTSSTRTMTIGNVDYKIELVNPADGYSGQDSSIDFKFNLPQEMNLGTTQCSLVLNGEETAVSNLGYSNTISKSVSPKNYSWNVKCISGAQTIISDSRSFTITAVSSGDSGGGGGGGSSGGGGGGGGPAVYSLTKEQLEEGVTKLLIKGAKFKVPVAEKSHYIILDEIKTGYVIITVSSEAQTFNLYLGNEKKVDADADNVYDLSIILKDISGTKAEISVQGISEPIEKIELTSTANTEEATEQNVGAGITGAVIDGVKNNKVPIAIMFVLILGIAGLLSYSSYKKKRISKND